SAATPPGYYSPNYFLDWAYEEALATLKEQGLSREYVIEVQTTIDQSLQKHAQLAAIIHRTSSMLHVRAESAGLTVRIWAGLVARVEG
ncbi:MAG: hypothetical protein GY767_11580, partial [Shimia sp.]|nr:hypothetical protein [Shimia sp.]